MKSILHTTALAVLITGAVTAVQASEATGLLLAEGGSERLMDYRLQQEVLLSNSPSQSSGQRFAQMLEEQPTAAGSAFEQQEQQVGASESRFRSPILRDRALYGSPH
ncbi:hypothetical protein P8H27_11975 [Pseudomonas sp. sp1636]|uniref:hypothetical protein n=1 Tax=Pseudomonas sp. sp1636 TaxID=3036707 RepID=UPI0025A5677E|nr:hypothetical protein [Pseudomonas sp. sp1636]MDM8349610.1 hypothetical protein [Pseudomonas sp. sp1636]